MGLIKDKIKVVKEKLNNVNTKAAKKVAAVATAATLVFAPMAGFIHYASNQNANQLAMIDAQQNEINELKNQINEIIKSSDNSDIDAKVEALTKMSEELRKMITTIEHALSIGSISDTEFDKRIAACEGLLAEIDKTISDIKNGTTQDVAGLNSYVIKSKVIDALENTIKDNYARLDVRLGDRGGENSYYCVYSSVNGDFASVDSRHETFLQEGDYVYYKNAETNQEYIAKAEKSIFDRLKKDIQYKGYEFSVSDIPEYDYIGYSTDGTETDIFVKLNGDDTINTYYTMDKDNVYTFIEFSPAYDYWYDGEARDARAEIATYGYAQTLLESTDIYAKNKYYHMIMSQTAHWESDTFTVEEGSREIFAHNNTVATTTTSANGYVNKTFLDGKTKKGYTTSDGETYTYEDKYSGTAQEAVSTYSFADMLMMLSEDVPHISLDYNEGTGVYSISVDSYGLLQTYNYLLHDDGTYQIDATAQDDKGNTAAASINITLTTKKAFESMCEEIESDIDAELAKQNGTNID